VGFLVDGFAVLDFPALIGLDVASCCCLEDEVGFNVVEFVGFAAPGAAAFVVDEEARIATTAEKRRTSLRLEHHIFRLDGLDDENDGLIQRMNNSLCS
jgi:hypothetical protein